MASIEGQTHSCHFPATGRQMGGHKRPLSVRVELQHLDTLEQLLEKDSGGEILSAVVKTAWALLLRCYTGLDEVCFEYEEIGTSRTSRSSDDSGGVSFLRIQEGMPIEELVKQAQDLPNNAPSLPYTEFQYNSSVLLRSGTAAASSKHSSSKTSVMSEKVQAASSRDTLADVKAVPASSPCQSSKVWYQRVPRIQELVYSN